MVNRYIVIILIGIFATTNTFAKSSQHDGCSSLPLHVTIEKESDFKLNTKSIKCAKIKKNTNRHFAGERQLFRIMCLSLIAGIFIPVLLSITAIILAGFTFGWFR